MPPLGTPGSGNRTARCGGGSSAGSRTRSATWSCTEPHLRSCRGWGSRERGGKPAGEGARRGGEVVGGALGGGRAAASALARPAENERLRFARDFLVGRGVRPGEFEKVLAANLTRFALEQRGYKEKRKS